MGEIVELLKSKMNYTIKRNECKACDHCVYKTKGRGEFVCELNPAVPFEVDPEGRCDFYKKTEAFLTKM